MFLSDKNRLRTLQKSRKEAKNPKGNARIVKDLKNDIKIILIKKLLRTGI
jgi:hypothetical protein